MTTDLSQLHPHKDFSSHKAARVGPYWIALAALALLGSGYAAFSSYQSAHEKVAPDSLGTAPLAAVDPHANLAVSEATPDLSDVEPVDETGLDPAEAKAEIGESTDLQTSESLDGVAAPATLEAAPEVATAAQAAVPGAYYLQVASYHTKETADAHAKGLSDRGLAAQSVAYGGPEAGWWHAVRVGPFKERFEAERRRFELPVQERKNAYVLPRSNGKFHVQVASFSEQEEALHIQKRFMAEGHSTKVTRVKMSGSYWHCVRIGPFDTREEATAYKALVADIPGSQSTVIPFGPPPKN